MVESFASGSFVLDSLAASFESYFQDLAAGVLIINNFCDTYWVSIELQHVAKGINDLACGSICIPIIGSRPAVKTYNQNISHIGLKSYLNDYGVGRNTTHTIWTQSYYYDTHTLLVEPDANEWSEVKSPGAIREDLRSFGQKRSNIGFPFRGPVLEAAALPSAECWQKPLTRLAAPG